MPFFSENEVDHPIWWHFLTVAIPDELTHPEAGLLYISYGSNGGKYVKSASYRCDNTPPHIMPTSKVLSLQLKTLKSLY